MSLLKTQNRGVREEREIARVSYGELMLWYAFILCMVYVTGRSRTRRGGGVRISQTDQSRGTYISLRLPMAFSPLAGVAAGRLSRGSYSWCMAPKVCAGHDLDVFASLARLGYEREGVRSYVRVVFYSSFAGCAFSEKSIERVIGNTVLSAYRSFWDNKKRSCFSCLSCFCLELVI